MKTLISRKTLFPVLALAAVFHAGNASAVDGMSVVYGDGSGGDSIDLARVGVQWEWDKSWFNDGNWELTGYWELDLGYWDGNNSNASATSQSSLIDIGITPVLRYQQKAGSGSVQPYVEVGIGAHLLSESKINNKDISTNFQFGDHIGLGARFGDQRAWDVSYRFQHFSNAGIDKPNPGVDFHQLRLGYYFD